MLKLVHSHRFKDEVESGVVVVDFFATWCGPCKMLAPVMEELSEEMNEKVKFIKVDIDQSLDLAKQFQVSSVPTMMIFKDGEKIDTLIGFLPKEKIKESIESHL
ncbi:thioredoxin [Clostridium uliginosum]|uniref:Thioredoxin n=1 Tax=Clostridium uliginosum TaxID=119641 RepID=A0A1I1SQR9_9CLOT|nr:thioredoxin [Clostridium uliginosum]SFD48701.1 thioredoxin 1 [Clostridium uliginosum]